jgi:hypothetical protein
MRIVVERVDEVSREFTAADHYVDAVEVADEGGVLRITDADGDALAWYSPNSWSAVFFHYGDDNS